MSSGLREAGLNLEAVTTRGGEGRSGTVTGWWLVSAGRDRTRAGGARLSGAGGGVNAGEAIGVPGLELAEAMLFAMAVELDSTSPSYVGESTPLSEERTAAIRGGAWWRIRCCAATRDWDWATESMVVETWLRETGMDVDDAASSVRGSLSSAQRVFFFNKKKKI